MPLKSHHLQSKDKTLHHLGSTGPDASFFFFFSNDLQIHCTENNSIFLLKFFL